MLPNETLEAQEIAWNNGDVHGYVENGYASDSGITFFSGGTRIEGYQNILSHYQNSYGKDGKEMGELSFRQINVEYLGKEHALVRGKWRLILKDGLWIDGWFTLIMIDDGGEWKIIHDHTSAPT